MTKQAKEKFSAKGAQALFAASFTYALTGVLVREMSPMWGDKAQVAVRYVLVFVCLMLYGHFCKIKTKIPKDKWLSALGLGITFALMVPFFTFAIQKTTLANTLFTFYATNLTVSFLLGTFILKEGVSRAKVLALMFAVAGLVLYSSELFAGNLGIIFSILAGIFGGISNLFTKQLRGADRNAVLRVQYGVGTVLTILLTILSRNEIIRTVSLRGAIITLVFSVVIIIGGNLVLYGYQHFDVNIGTVIMSMELVFGAVLGWLFYGEIPAIHELLGGTLIFTGSVLGSLDLENYKSFSLPKKIL